MPEIEGSFRTGWILVFDLEETKRIADPIVDGGAFVSASLALVPDPTVSKALAAVSAAVTFGAKQALKRDLALGLYVRGNPLRFINYLALVRDEVLLKGVYSRSLPFAPFLYDPDDSDALQTWRKAVGIT